MAKSTKLDQFVQRISVQCQQSAGGGDILTQIPTAFSPKDKTGLILHRIEYHMDGAIETNFAAKGDICYFGLAYAQAAPLLLATPTNLGSIDWNAVAREDFTLGAPAADLTVLFGKMRNTSRDWTQMPGGGLLCHPSALYFWAYNQALSAAPLIWFDVMIWYTTIELSEELYRELWEMRVTAQTT